MKFVFAPDSFKGSLTAQEMCAFLAEEAQRAFPGCETVSLPVADGGEGTADALATACGGEMRRARVTGPMGEPAEAHFALLPGGAAVVEMAQASGLPLVTGKKNPLTASSFGTGELILHALDAGAERLLIGIGGSATNDGGMGMLSALGARFYGAQGETLRGSGAELARAARADFDGLDARLAWTQIEVICDVTNPLLGPDGATVVYGPQKGVTPAMSTALEAGMANYAALLENTLGRDVSRFPGAGAAGGMGAALGGVLGARLKKGIDAVLDAVDFDARIAGCDAVFTGEGRIDRQSVAFGKATAGVARRCRKQDVPVIAIVGGMGPGAEAFYDEGRVSIFTTVNGPMTVETAIKNAAPLYRDAARRAFQTLAIGRGLK